MGLTKSSVGRGAVDYGLEIKRQSTADGIIALAGNPNVGKSTVFNALTGMKQHTGNWPGKTVSIAQGFFKTEKHRCIAVDLPGTYSLSAHSAEEEVARNFICFEEHSAVVVVCDATVLERGLGLALQAIEATRCVVLCVNLIDEAERRGIRLDLAALSRASGVPAVGTAARKKSTLAGLLAAVDTAIDSDFHTPPAVGYPEPVERALATLLPELKRVSRGRLGGRFHALKLLERDPAFINKINTRFGEELLKSPSLFSALSAAEEILSAAGIKAEALSDITAEAIQARAEALAEAAVKTAGSGYSETDRKLDRILTGKFTAFPVMLLLLAAVLWLTVSGANYPSELLSRGFSAIEGLLYRALCSAKLPQAVTNALVFGVWRVTATVISVMLPPMAVFFPIFTFLEDSGYLPRVAYNLDRPFKCCNACGKQALTVCMGFGCNAAGIVGCRIIDSPRERMLAMLTNSFIPCNGRFPMLISVITMFFAANALSGAGLLTLAVLFAIAASLLATRLLSKTLLRGVPSSYTLELPPYRRPQLGKIIIRSVFDRTLFVLGRAVAVAAPAGLVIWLSANISIGESSILSLCAGVLDPIGSLMGLDGTILLAFILGFPANETVIPIITMAYAASGTLQSGIGLSEIHTLFLLNGWSAKTAVCFIIFTLMHWPCSTALLTLKKETGSVKQMLLAAALPTLAGATLCTAVNLISRFIRILQ